MSLPVVDEQPDREFRGGHDRPVFAIDHSM
jgi:hypothetical protein